MIGKPGKFPLLALALLFFVSGCANQLLGAQVFKTETSKAITEASERFDHYDEARQDKIVADSKPGEVLSNLDAYINQTQLPIRKAFISANGALTAYSAALSMTEKGLKADWLGLGLQLLRSGSELEETIRRSKIALPFKMPKFFTDAIAAVNAATGSTGGGK